MKRVIDLSALKSTLAPWLPTLEKASALLANDPLHIQTLATICLLMNEVRTAPFKKMPRHQKDEVQEDAKFVALIAGEVLVLKILAHKMVQMSSGFNDILERAFGMGLHGTNHDLWSKLNLAINAIFRAAACDGKQFLTTVKKSQLNAEKIVELQKLYGHARDCMEPRTAKKQRPKKKNHVTLEDTIQMPDENHPEPSAYWETLDHCMWHAPFVMDMYGMPIESHTMDSHVDFWNVDVDCSDVEEHHHNFAEHQKVQMMPEVSEASSSSCL